MSCSDTGRIWMGGSAGVSTFNGFLDEIVTNYGDFNNKKFWYGTG